MLGSVSAGQRLVGGRDRVRTCDPFRVSKTEGDRCASRRCPRSPLTVEVKGNALLTSRETLSFQPPADTRHYYIMPSSCGYVKVGGDADRAEV